MIDNAVELILAEIAQKGQLHTPELKAFFRPAQKNGKRRPVIGEELAVRDEVLIHLLYTNGDDTDEVARQTGASKDIVRKTLARWKRMVDRCQVLVDKRLQDELDLEQVRYESRKKMIERVELAAARALEHAIAQIGSLKGVAAVTAFAIFNDKMLLLSGQPTSRKATVSEREIPDDELDAKLEEARKAAADLKLVG